MNTQFELQKWITERGGIVHRAAATEAGFLRPRVNAEVRAGAVEAIRRHWLATAAAPRGLVVAAHASAKVACTTAAELRNWWMPEGTTSELHLAMSPHAAAPGVAAIAHWTKPIAPAPRHSLIESIEDSLAHIARCLPPEQALVVWESAARQERLDPLALRSIRWPNKAAAKLAEQVTGLSDSGLETLPFVRLSAFGLPIRQQTIVAGHRVDLLIGQRLIVQIDGFAHHSTPAQRTRDLAHDAELRLRGYTVLRFSYAQVIHDWAYVERTIARAIAAGAHLA